MERSQIKKATDYLRLNKKEIDNRLSNSSRFDLPFPPIGWDIDHPQFWTGYHWRYFIDTYIKTHEKVSTVGKRKKRLDSRQSNSHLRSSCMESKESGITTLKDVKQALHIRPKRK